jgi:phospholipid/cholesterol/gamma-HCH transport system substrate-binding protein
MDSGENKRAVIVGIFIALGIVIFVLGVFTLGSSQKSFGSGITVNAVFSDVEGLKKGNSVWFSGVKIGTINNIEFTGISQVAVKLTVDKSVQNYIHKNADVKISSDGLIGNKIIVIEGGSADAPVVQDGDVLSVKKSLSTDDIMDTLQQNNKNLLAITTNFKKVSQEIIEGKGMVGALMGDTAMVMKFRSILQKMDNTTTATNQMALQLEKFGTKLNGKGTLADKLLTDTVTYNKLSAAADNFHKASVNVTQTMDNLNQATSKLNGTNSIIGVLLNDPKGATQVQSTIDNLHQGSIKLNDDLEAAQHNFLLKGYFKDRAKAQADSLKKAGKK